ncbi:MAG: DUF2235 domain-containing protein [Kiritimatiellae bacterium]|nr:DUF2235 domain-containing protein [Kiritimatiellia bacterium]
MAAEKNCILLTEGTGQGESSDISNVTLLANTLVQDERQVFNLLPGPGVNTFAKLSAWALGRGIIDRVVSHYEFLSKEYVKANGKLKIFLFGFSRGALIARCLADLICKTGIPLDANLARRILKYHRGNCREDLKSLREKGKLSDPQMVEYLGVWDTVDASLEVRGEKLIDVPELVKKARHAVAADEKRCFFEPVVMRGKNCEEKFFPGVHQDIGGGYSDNHLLSDVCLAWIANPAIKAGMLVKSGVSFSEKCDYKKAVIHDSSTSASNLFGILPTVKRFIDFKRAHSSLLAMGNRER